MRKSRGRTRHTLEREHETPRSIHRREECEGEKERRQSRPRGGTLRVQEEETHILPCYRVVAACLGTPPEENPKPLEDTLLWMLLGVSCSLSRVCLVLPLLFLIRGL
jgi:hypothetical protein